MRIEKREIVVQGQKTGTVCLTCYLLDSISVNPDILRPAVIVLPGGGYSRRSDRESEPIALQFMAMGCHAFILDYSVDPNRFPTSLRELAEAVAVIRQHGAEWKVDTNKIIPCGFSAAGHLACSLGVFWDRDFVWEAIKSTPEEIRPSGLILNYPVITSGEFKHAGSILSLLGENATKEETEAVSLENFVTEKIPKTFLWHTYTDAAVPLENSLLLAAAMRRHQVNFELHVYPAGVHGLSLASVETAGSNESLLEPSCQSWISLAKTWLSNF